MNAAILQKIDEQKLTLSIDGEVQEIKLQLEELRKILQEKQVQNIQYAEKIYNIEHINEANFGFVTGKKAFNEHLTKAIFGAIRPHSKNAAHLLKQIESRNILDWEKQVRISDKAKEIIAYKFVGVIGKQLAKLMAIGKEELTEKKQQKYIQKCIHILSYSLDLINYVLLSKLWDEQKSNAQLLKEDIYKIISMQFDNTFESSILDRFLLFQTLFRLFKTHSLPLPLLELEDIQAQFQAESPLFQVIQNMQALSVKLDQLKYDLLDCFEAEKELANFFQFFAFLVNYNMASIKHIGYREVRNDAPIYLHSFTALGIDSKANVDAEKMIGVTDTVHTDAVLFFRGNDYRESINLYPFVIDYNTLTAEHGAKICFFQCIHLEDNSLEYVFLADNSTINIEQKGQPEPPVDLGELMMDAEKRKIFNLNCVVKGFEQAKKDILAELDLDNF